MLLLNRIQEKSETIPAHIALTDGVRNVTYGELNSKIEETSQKLKDTECRRLAIAGDNSIEWILYDLAALSLNIPVIPLPPFFIQSQRAAVLKSAGVTHITLGQSLVPTGFAAEGVTLPEGTDKITYTSGSTGTPKGVCLPQSGLEKVAKSIADFLGSHHVGKHLCVLPLAVLLENVAGVYTALMTGATIYVPPLAAIGFSDPFRPDFGLLLDIMIAHEVTSVILVPELLRGLMMAIHQIGKTPRTLTFAAVGGAKVDPEMLALAQAAGLPVYEGYGLSECGSVVSLNTPRRTKSGSAGKILPHMHVSIKNDEIIVENACFLGYLGEAPREARLFSTGDLGAIDDEGFITLQGRRKNLIITGYGRNISPEWVESTLLAQPDIRHAIVFGEGAESLGALIVPTQQDADIATAIANANDKLPPYAQVKNIREIPALTAENGFLTGNGRIKRENILKHFLKE
jgi:long-chain acyl-CoA synthetase